MALFPGFVGGFIKVLTITSAPQMYRYPYRNSAEALRGDMQKVGRDMETTLERIVVKE